MGIPIRHFIRAAPPVPPVDPLPYAVFVAAPPTVLIAVVGRAVAQDFAARLACLAAIAHAPAGTTGADPEARPALGVGAGSRLEFDDAVHDRHPLDNGRLTWEPGTILEDGDPFRVAAWAKPVARSWPFPSSVLPAYRIRR